MSKTSVLETYANQVLIFHGDNDDIVPMKLGEKLSKHLKNSRFFRIKGAGHNNIVFEEG